MAREILFKAKRKDNGEWVEGGSLITFLDNGEKSFFMPQFNEKCICEHDEMTDDILSFSDCRFYKVDPETICRYTGLTDKNDNKIWENDIVTEDWRNEKGIVRFGEFEAQVLKNIGFNIEWNYISYRQDICYWVGKCEVIGNVFDNPELLEGGNE